MRWSNSFIQTQKETPSEAEAVSHKLMLRAGLIRLLTSGVYSYLPLGLRSLRKVEAMIREEMNREGAQEVLLPALQPAELWQMSGRYDVLGEDMISFKDRHGKLNVLGPTHEEVITTLVKGEVKSYRQLPLILYQIQTKFRDEARPRFGVIRSREFIMKDAYSFDADEKSLSESYDRMLSAYERIFKRCGLTTMRVEADPGVMGGNRSHEFLVPTESGEEVIQKDGVTLRGLEIGHIFQLGTKYTASLDATYLDAQGKRKPILMGCYGIGVNRILAAVIEQHHDENGIIWPFSVAPFQLLILPLFSEEECLKISEDLYEEGLRKGWEILLDDREERPGIKFKDGDLIGIPFQLIIGQSALKEGKFEIKRRRDGETLKVSRAEIFGKLKELCEAGLSQGNEKEDNSSQVTAGSLVDTLRKIVSEILEIRGTELVDLIYRREGPKHVLRILADTPAGISLNECAELNQVIGEALDEKNLIQESYLLEVCSPGLDRPLLTPRDFKRAIGKPVRLLFKQPLKGRVEMRGTLEEVIEEKLILRLEDLETVEISINVLSRGERVIQF